MYQKFTPIDSDECCHVMEKENFFQSLHPKQETLALIRQFASVYYVENKLPGQLSELILN